MIRCTKFALPGLEGAPIILNGSIIGLITNGCMDLDEKSESEGIAITLEMVKDL